MGRNFFRRIETAAPIAAPELKNASSAKRLEMALADNTHAWLMQPDGGYIRAAPAEGESEADLQNDLWTLLGG